MSRFRASSGPERPSYWRLVAQIVRGVGGGFHTHQAPLRQDLYVRSGWWRTGARRRATGGSSPSP